jgi:sec-independent protein translocase protein TatC
VTGPSTPDRDDGPVPRGTPEGSAAPSSDAASGDPAADPGVPSEADDQHGMGFLDHLEELRSVLIHSLVAAAAAAVLCWFWSADLLDLLVRPLKDSGVYFTAPNEAFLTRLKLAAIVGLFLVLPFILWKVYGFILPGLYSRERRVITPLIIATTVLFYAGVSFSFLVVSPAVITFLLSFGTEILDPLIGIGPYFAFVAQLSLAFGLIFELPVLVFFLSVAGLVDPRLLLRTWRYAVVLIGVAAAVLTPPDIFSQLAMAVPVVILYISSVLVAIVATRRKRRERDLERSGGGEPDGGDGPAKRDD